MHTHKDILIVDDEPWYRNRFNKELKSAGFHTALAQNAQEALVALWEKENIGLVLLDVRLPVITGINIFEIIRKDFPDKKIIVTSILHQEEQKFLIYDADDYFDKSQEMFVLIQKVNEVFSKSIRGKIRSDEKRSFKRMPVSLLASCEGVSHDNHSPGTHFLSYTKDLSLCGGKFIIGEDVKVGQHFTVALELPVNFLPLLINCEVVWVKRMDNPERRIIAGVKFIKLDTPRDEEKLKNYLSYV